MILTYSYQIMRYQSMLQVINIRTLFNDNYRFANPNSLTVEGIGYGYWVIESKMNGPVFQFLPT